MLLKRHRLSICTLYNMMLLKRHLLHVYLFHYDIIEKTAGTYLYPHQCDIKNISGMCTYSTMILLKNRWYMSVHFTV